MVNIDTGVPSTTAKAVIVRAGKTATFRFKVADPSPGCGTATVRLAISRAGGKAVKTVSVGQVDTNEPLTYKWKATLKKGTYAYRVLATDAEDNAADPARSAMLRIK